ncbi:MAG: SpoIIE family protein phosphatase [Spirochaetales bacterium]|nr:SpoIIE family protein phosphatase [Spirochaetales bacterium]
MDTLENLEARDILEDRNSDQNTHFFSATQVGHTVILTDPITTYYTLTQAMDIFKANPDLTSIPVEGDRGVTGLLHLSDAKNRKHSLLSTVHVDSVMRRLNDSVDAKESIEKVIQTLLDSESGVIFDDIPVFYHGRFYGTTNFIRLSRYLNENRSQDMQRARKLQQFLMEKSKLQETGCKIDIYNRMAYSLGGDFYKIIRLSERRSLIASFDVSGKGISGSLSTAIISSFFTTIEVAEAMADLTPQQIVTLLNTTIFEQTPSEVYVTALFVFVDSGEKVYRVCNCGHTPLWMRPSLHEDIVDMEPTAPPLGIMDELPDPDSLFSDIPLDKDTQLFIFSDGLTDIRNLDGIEYGEEGLKKFLQKSRDKAADTIIKDIDQEVSRFIGKAPQTDDVTLIIIQWEEEKNTKAEQGGQILSAVRKVSLVEDGFSAYLLAQVRNEGNEKKMCYSRLLSKNGRFLLLHLKPSDIRFSGYFTKGRQIIHYDSQKKELPVADSHPLYGALFDSLMLMDPAMIKTASVTDIQEETVNGITTHRLDLNANERTFALYVRKDNFLPVRLTGVEPAARKNVIVDYKNWTGIGGSYYPGNMTFTSPDIPGLKEELVFTKIQRQNMGDEVFSAAFIEKLEQKNPV